MIYGQSRVTCWLVHFYGWALRLYPESVRREYGQEMRAVFSLKAQDARRQGGFTLVGFACQEVRDLPGAILSSHLKERKTKMKPVTVNPIPGASLNAWKIGAVFLPFGLALLYSAHHYVPSTLFTVLGLTLLGLLIAVWIAGLAKTFPLWSLPSLGMLFFIIYFFLIYASALQFVYSFNGGWSKDLSQGIRMLLSASLVTLLIAALAFFSLLQLIPRWREQVRQDWTQLSFFLYGLAILPLFMNDEFTHLWAYQATGLLLLALGAGLYLIAPHRWQRILVLFVPVVLCQALFSLGLYQTYPLESWISLVDPNQRLWEALYPLSDPLPFLLLLPALVPIIPWKGNPEPVTYGEPARAEES